MQFHKGQTVVYPFHGPMRVTDLVTRVSAERPRCEHAPRESSPGAGRSVCRAHIETNADSPGHRPSREASRGRHRNPRVRTSGTHSVMTPRPATPNNHGYSCFLSPRSTRSAMSSAAATRRTASSASLGSRSLSSSAR